MAASDDRTAEYSPDSRDPSTQSLSSFDVTTIGRFEVREVLGRGGFGTVYLAFDPSLHREVAVKVPSREALTDTDRERFLREARAVAGVHHPHVCPVFEVGEQAGRPFLVFQYVPGPTLAGWLKDRGPLPPADAVRLLGAVADGVQSAHEAGVIHRDLKPANVLMAGDRPLVTDFGLARKAGGPLRTAVGMVVGTLGTWPPEQASGERDKVGKPTDVYALGVMLFELLTGKPPFVGQPTEVMRAKLMGDPPSLAAARPDLPAGLDAVCRRAMAREPADRFPTVAEFAAALRAAVPAPAGGPPWLWIGVAGAAVVVIAGLLIRLAS